MRYVIRARARAMRLLKLNFQILIHAHTRFARPAVVACIVWKITLTYMRVGTVAVPSVAHGFHRPPRLPLILTQNRHYAMCPDMCQSITADL